MFLNAPSASKRPALSPTAEVFTPGLPIHTFEIIGVNHGPSRADDRHTLVRAAKADEAPPAAAVGYVYRPNRPIPNIDAHANENIGVRPLLHGSTPDRNANALTPEQAPRPAPGVIGGPCAVASDMDVLCGELRDLAIEDWQYNTFGGVFLHDVRFRQGSFSTDENVTRAFVVSGNPLDGRSAEITKIIKVCFLAPYFIA